VPNFILNGTKLAQFSNLKEMNYILSVGIAGAPGTIRTCDPQYRKLC